MKKMNLDWNHTVIDLFQKQVKNFPETIALHYETTQLTYQALNEKSNQAAHWLQHQQVSSGDFVAMLFEPGIDFVLQRTLYW